MQDEVDRLVAAWARERPDLDVRPLEVLSGVTGGTAPRRAGRTAFAAHDLEVWEFDVLSALRRAGRPYVLSPGQLLAQTMVTSGTMTNRVDRLEQRGPRAADARPRRPARRARAAHPAGQGTGGRRAGRPAGPRARAARSASRRVSRRPCSALLRQLVAPFETT